MLSSETSEVAVLLVALTHADITTIRIANDMQAVTSNGNTYDAFPFEVTLPNDDPDDLSRTTLTVCNVDRSMVTAFRSLSSAATATLSLVLASAPDTVIAGPFEFLVRAVTYDVETVSCTLAYEDVLNEPIPGDIFDPTNFRGLFS
jgi:hypothetical protein